MTVQQEATQQGVILTEGAAVKVSNLLAQEGRDDLRLRIAVQPGGCSGLRYQLYFDDRSIDGDIVAEFSGVEVVTDKMSAPYLMGATIDFVDTIEKQGFTIDNPNALGFLRLRRLVPLIGADRRHGVGRHRPPDDLSREVHRASHCGQA